MTLTVCWWISRKGTVTRLNWRSRHTLANTQSSGEHINSNSLSETLLSGGDTPTAHKRYERNRRTAAISDRHHTRSATSNALTNASQSVSQFDTFATVSHARVARSPYVNELRFSVND
ncbi:unnamed protein product [Cylicostephanus goldi]|uniref:Uncharacterized protein n=1 Tax=Cylicostephanus goldi TaxID=71465 RepID=A0A3P6SJS0_CYLGO|nr:unnamed protein product [Cylicostephanus goldi]